jgi:hypothetical protein
MNFVIKQILIISFVFLTILWFQNMEDKKYNKERKTLYEKYKFPILVSAITGLLLHLNINKMFSNCEKQTSEIIIVSPINAKSSHFTKADYTKPFINDSVFSKELTDQQIFTDLPDF